MTRVLLLLSVSEAQYEHLFPRGNHIKYRALPHLVLTCDQLKLSC